MSQRSRIRGTVSLWIATKKGEGGYGFIELEEDPGEENEVFVHMSDVEPPESLREGDYVEFEVAPPVGREKSRNAKKVVIITRALESGAQDHDGDIDGEGLLKFFTGDDDEEMDLDEWDVSPDQRPLRRNPPPLS